MSQVIGESQAEQVEHGQSKMVKAAGVGMALMGASMPTSGEQHVDHGHAPARTVACLISGLGFLAGGIAFPFHVWPVVIIGGVLQIVAVIANVALNGAGLGAKSNRDWAEAKARAKAARAA
jgi:hypothetical protein